MIDYIGYGKWECGEIRCTVCGGVIEHNVFSWTVEYYDGDMFHFHQSCIAKESESLLAFLCNQNLGIIPFEKADSCHPKGQDKDVEAQIEEAGLFLAAVRRGDLNKEGGD